MEKKSFEQKAKEYKEFMNDKAGVHFISLDEPEDYNVNFLTKGQIEYYAAEVDFQEYLDETGDDTLDKKRAAWVYYTYKVLPEYEECLEEYFG